jgi:molybdate transport system substrate-binding protein
MNYPKIAITAFALVAAIPAVGIANAADIKVLSSGSLKVALPQLAADFQKSSGNMVTVVYSPAGAITNLIKKGDAADVAIVSRSQLEGLESQGKVVPGSRITVAGSALGVAVRKGAAKPDIGSVDSFKRALLSARAIGYRDPATGSLSGTYTAGLLERLGLAQQLKPKTRLDNSDGENPENVFRALTTGEIDLQIGQISEIVIASGIELAGPLPDEIQNVSWLAAGIVATSKEQEAARSFIAFIASPAAAAVFKAKGFQPSGKN